MLLFKADVLDDDGYKYDGATLTSQSVNLGQLRSIELQLDLYFFIKFTISGKLNEFLEMQSSLKKTDLMYRISSISNIW